MPEPTSRPREYIEYPSAYAPPAERYRDYAPPSVPATSLEYSEYSEHHHHHHPHNAEGDYAPPPLYPEYGQYAPPPGPPPPRDYLPPSGPPGDYSTYTPPDGPPPRPPVEHQHFGPVFQDENGNDRLLHFQYSQCTGKRKALCIGINYIGQSAELKGCINDAHNVRRFLCEDYGYQDADIVMLTDDSSNPRSIPTKENMIEAMQWLISNAQPHDALFFHYSGHGGQTKDLNGDEDGYDDVIYPVDFQENGPLVDDMLHDILVKPLPPGCRLTTIFDSCHSGTALDLPYIYNHYGKIKEPDLEQEASQGLLAAFAGRGFARAFSSANEFMGRDRRLLQTKTSPADVISWSGCKDSQTSADTFEAGQATGAMSYAFMTSLRQNRHQSYQQLLVNVRGMLAQHYNQTPQLSSSHPMDTSLLFIC
ncbi:caspase domain-containing protein [Sparassis latifolia]